MGFEILFQVLVHVESPLALIFFVCVVHFVSVLVSISLFVFVFVFVAPDMI